MVHKIDLKSLLSTSNSISMTDIRNGVRFKNGRNNIICDNIVIDSFFINEGKQEASKIYVFLSAIGVRGRRYPLFNRVSWHEFYDGICIFFDDPYRKIYNFAPCFYFGKQNEDLTLQIEEIIKLTLRNYGYDNSNLVIISSSNGGFAAISLCDKLAGSKSLAFNPQLDIESFFSNEVYDEFKHLVGYNSIQNNITRTEDRLNLYNIINNKKSKFFIYSNIASGSDRTQIEKFFNYLNYKWNLGLNIINDNIYIYILQILIT